ncbi:MAG: glycogen/starch/alpha-glucan family phosphorylase [Chlamydiia bacterium]|nr:glycogen/starch/alpha-glucan family phosphorylase [Chlamydiia bacterium]
MDNIDFQADVLAQKIRHHIITTFGRRAQDASDEEFFQAFCATFREEMMMNWTATLDTIEQHRVRMVYFISMEYLPGRLLKNNLLNVGAGDLVRAVLAKLHRNFENILSCEPDAGLGNGGLGRLSSCFLDSLATLHYPARGYGLRYQYGIFDQEIWNSNQVERPDGWLLNMNPWEFRRDAHATSVHFKGHPTIGQNEYGEEIELLEHAEEVRALPYDTPIIGYSPAPTYSVLMLRLWSTKESPRNFQLQRFNAGLAEQASENTSLTDVLYPNDNTELGKKIRLKQEFLLASASLQDILRHTLRVHGSLSQLADKVRIQINDTHPALIIAELVRTLTKNHNFSWESAWEICRTCCSYTNHTILREALEEWNERRIYELLPRQHRVIQRLNQQFCDQVRKTFPHNEEMVRRTSVIENGQIRMAHLAILGSHKINGVARLHTELLKQNVFKDFVDLFPDAFINITNGVTQRRWLLAANPLLAQFITTRIGEGWITDFSQISRLTKYASDPASQQEFLAIKQANKQALIRYLASENAVRDGEGKIIAHTAPTNVQALFDVQVKRFHEYKRQILHVLHLIMVYQELLENPNARPVARISFFGGKAAPGYAKAQQILHLTCAVARTLQQDPRISDRLQAVFIENYNVSKAEIIIPAADLSEQISTAGWEASGTGNMKLAINGALTIGTEDGANIEMREAIGDAWWPFSFGASAKEMTAPYRPRDIYSQDEQIKRAVDSLKDGPFASSEIESALLLQLHHYLTEFDPYRVLKDLRAYYDTQKRVEELFIHPSLWAEMAIHNMAGMGRFSTDVSIHNYAEKIWDLKPCPPDPSILARVLQEYSEHDRCRIHHVSSTNYRK